MTYTDTEWMFCWVEKLPSGKYVVVRRRHHAFQGRPYDTEAEAQAKANAANERMRGPRVTMRPSSARVGTERTGASRWGELVDRFLA